MTEIFSIYLIPRGRQNPRRQDGARRAGPAHCLRRKRNQLLREVPDGGKLLADRSLSRLLKADWPRTLEEMEEGKKARNE
jgi:hypothetical protein